MSEPFIGEIRMVGFSFAPRGWAFCQGQLLNIATNSALFSLLGTTYGGNGQTTFGLPDLRGRMPVGQGNGPGLNPVTIGQLAGTQSTTLTLNNLPMHNHVAQFTGTGGGGSDLSITVTVPAANVGASESNPVGNILAQSQQPGRSPVPVSSYALPTAATGALGGVTAAVTGGHWITGGTVAVGPAGGSQPFSVMNPFLGMNFIIALEGIFPSRN